MNGIDIALLLVLAGVVFLALRKSIRSKGSCGCSGAECTCCSESCSACPKSDPKDKSKN